jgi:two-component system, OmpR family, phosphate regulon response regulator PhoB
MAKKILVIDDDTDIRDTLVFLLENEKYEVTTSEDAKILKGINQLNPDLIIMDNFLSEWKSDASGKELSRALKLNPATRHIPIILISAASNVQEIAKTGHADAFLRKPFESDDLLAIIQKHLK